MKTILINLGETEEKTNRFGRLEEYVHGNLEDALLKLNSLKIKLKLKKVEKIEETRKPKKSEIFEDLFLENTN